MCAYVYLSRVDFEQETAGLKGRSWHWYLALSLQGLPCHSADPGDHRVGLEAELRPSPSPLPPCPGVHIQSSQIVESSGLYTLRSVLKAQLTKEDKDAQFYCELSYRLPSGNHMKESREVTVPVFCEYRPIAVGLGPASSWAESCPLCLCRPGRESVAGSGA